MCVLFGLRFNFGAAVLALAVRDEREGERKLDLNTYQNTYLYLRALSAPNNNSTET